MYGVKIIFMSHHKKEAHHLRPYKILAQSFATLVCGFYILYLLGEGFANIVSTIGGSLTAILPNMFLPIAGYLLTWLNEKLGAIILLIGGIILFFYFYMEEDVSRAIYFGIPFIIAGGLYLLHLKKRNELQHKK